MTELKCDGFRESMTFYHVLQIHIQLYFILVCRNERKPITGNEQRYIVPTAVHMYKICL